MDHDGVAVAGEAEQHRELWPLGVLAGGVVGEQAVDVRPVELAIRVLLEAADPDVAEALAGHGLTPAKCQDELYNLPFNMSRKAFR